MIRWRVPELLKELNWTPYRLAKEAGLTVPAAYRLAKGEPVQRIDTETLERLCDVFERSPGELIERVATSRGSRRRG